MDGLGKRVIGSLAWSGAGQVARQVVTIVIGILLARALGPTEFGLFAMLAVFIGFADMCLELGLGSALVQRQAIDERHRSSVFWFTLVAGVAVGGLWLVAAPAVAAFYDRPVLVPLATALSVSFVLGSIKCVPLALAMRSLSFKKLAVIEVLGSVLAGAVALVMAWRGAGAWCLVAQLLIRHTVVAALLWGSSGWRPKMMFSPSALREVIGFGGSVVGFRVTDYLSMRFDHLVIGRLISPLSLGAYSKAQDLVSLPLKQINAAASRVMFPALAAIQSNRGRVRKAYCRALGLVALAAFPMMIGAAVVAEPLILALLGEAWAPVVPIFQLLCIAGVSQSIGVTTGWIFLSQGRADLMFRWGVAAAILRITAVLIGVRWGVMGVATGQMIASYLLLYPAFAIPGRLIDLTFGDVLRVVRAPLACATAMAAVTLGIDYGLPPDASPWLVLAIEIPATGRWLACFAWSRTGSSLASSRRASPSPPAREPPPDPVPRPPAGMIRPR
jgi:PST family polysaccharide transporter